MNRIRKLMSFIFVLAVVLNALATTENIRYCLTIDMDEVEMDTVNFEGETFSSLRIGELSNTYEDNEPSLPIKYVSFKVPTYCNNIKASVLSSTPIGTECIVNPILPGINIPTRSDFTPNAEMLATTGEGYTQVNIKPSVKVCDEFFVNGDDHIVTLGISPVGYNYPAGELHFYSDIQVELVYDLCEKGEMLFEPFVGGDDKAINVSLLVENESDRQRIGNYKDGDKVVALKNYVILVPENLKDAVSRLSKWKEQKGYKVKVQTVEDILKDPKFKIGSNAACFDKESSVKEWLKAYYTSNNAFFCLIIGDYRTSAPIRKFYAIADDASIRDPKNPNGEDYTPTDGYFSDLTSKWTLKKYECGLYSCDISTASFSPTIPVGRLLCSTKEEIERYTDKLILYELWPGRGDTDYLLEGFFVQHYDGVKSNHPSIFNSLPQYNVKVFKDNHAAKIADLRPLGNELVKAMNGCGLMSWQAHGDPISLMCAQVSDLSANWPQRRFIMAQTKYADFRETYTADKEHGLELIHNEGYPAVAYSIACSIAPFDNLDVGDKWMGKVPEYNIASAFTVAGDYGGPAVLANTRNGYWSSSTAMEKEFGKYLMENSCIGISELYSKIASTSKNIKFRHHVIGDPEFNIWTSIPSEFGGTATVKNNVLTLSGSNIGHGFYGVSSPSLKSQTEYNVTNKSLSISLANSLANSQIATVYVWQNNFLPLTQIVTTGNEIIGQNCDFFLTIGHFASDANSGKSYPIGHHPAYLNIGASTNITVNVLDKVISEGGVVIRNNGSLTLNSDRTELSNDKVLSGGALIVKSRQITLNEGVLIEAGATAEFLTN